MSGKVDELGYNQALVCGSPSRPGCGQSIYWGKMFGKRHPFNPDGTSHMDSCPHVSEFRKGYGPSIRTLGDRDTFYRSRWQTQYCGYKGRGSVKANREFDVSAWSRVELPDNVARELAQVLCAESRQD